MNNNRNREILSCISPAESDTQIFTVVKWGSERDRKFFSIKDNLQTDLELLNINGT